MIRLRTIAVAGALVWMSLSLRSSASLRQEEMDRYLAAQLLSLEVSAASLEFFYAREHRSRENRLLGTGTERDLDNYEARANLSVEGFIFHPYFVDFSGAGAVGYSADRGNVDAYGGEGEIDSRTYVGDYSLSFSIFKRMPLAFRLFGSRATSRSDSDFFSRFTSEGESYGIAARYRNGLGPLNCSYVRSSSDAWGLDTRSHSEDGTLSADLYSHFFGGDTRVTYVRQTFYRETDGMALNDGMQQDATFSDLRGLGRNGSLYTAARYTRQEATHSEFRTLTFNQGADVSFLDVWSAYGSYAYTRYTTEGLSSEDYAADATLTHRLFESLTTTLTADGGVSDFGGRSVRNGVTASESYTKRIGDWTRLDLSYRYRKAWDRRISGGADESAFRELLVLRDGEGVFLGALDVDRFSVEVTDEAGVGVYLEGFDYDVISVGRRTQIQRVVGGRIPTGSTVAVTYRAARGGDERFTTASDAYSFRIHMFDNHAEVYGSHSRYRTGGDIESSAAEGEETTLGASCSWGWFLAGIEYVDSNLSLSEFERRTAYESVQYSPFARTQLGLYLQQSVIEYDGGSDRQTSHSETASMTVTVSRDATLRLQAGHYRQKKLSEDDERGIINAGLDFRIGLLNISMEYEYQHRDLTGIGRGEDEEQLHRAQIRLRRTL